MQVAAPGQAVISPFERHRVAQPHRRFVFSKPSTGRAASGRLRCSSCAVVRIHAVRQRFGDVVLGRRSRRLVALLDQQPRLLALVTSAAHPYQRPTALQFFALQLELQLALTIAFAWISIRNPNAAIPHDDGARAVLPRRDHAFKGCIGERVIFDMHRHALVGRIQTPDPSALPSSSTCRRARGESRNADGAPHASE